MKRIITIILLTISVLIIPQHSLCEESDPPRFSLITVGQGSEVYLLEGHSALRIEWPDGRDLMVNWGMFDFADPGFAMKFARGETDYWVDAEPTPLFMRHYIASGRRVEQQQLNLSPLQAQALQQLISDNLRPANRVYRYRYLTDNCATRPLAIVEQAIRSTGDSLVIDNSLSDTTWRNELRSYHRNHPLYQLFIDIALGAGVDSPITSRQRAFAPIYLNELAAGALIISSDGTERPLTMPSQTLYGGVDGVAGSEPSPWWGIAPFVAFSLIVSLYEIRRRRLVKWANALIFTLYGIVGMMVAFLVGISSQEATGSNINLLWLNPLPLLAIALIWTKPTRRVLAPIMGLIAAMAAIYLLGSPFWHQSTPPTLISLALGELITAATYIYTQRK